MLKRNNLAGQAEIESMNADVMRFMAILGLCLMLIFAALQGAYHEQQIRQEDQQKISAQQQLNRQLQAQIQFNHDLSAQKNTLQQQLQAQQQAFNAQLPIKHQLQQQLSQLEQENSQQKQQLKQQSTQLQQAQQQTLTQTARLQQLQQRLQNMQQSMQQSIQPLQAKQQKQAKPKPIGANKTKPDRKKPDRKKQGHEQPKHTAQTAQNPKPDVPPKPPAKGFTLQFANNDTFIQLIKNHTIKLILRHQNKVYQVQQQGQIQLLTIKTQRQIYPLHSSTIPALYQQVLGRLSSADKSTQWGVILPPLIKQQLSRIMQQYSHGRLLILATGEIKRDV